MEVFQYINNSDLYKSIGTGEYMNIRTGKSGIVDNEKAKNIFTINKAATELISDFPIIEEMILKLNLKLDNK